MEFVLGLVGFALFFLYDWHSVKPAVPVCGSFFALGCVCVAVGTGWSLWRAVDNLWPPGAVRAALLVMCAVGLAGMVYTLFFALPFSETYVEQSVGRAAYMGGMYALCRHPGVLWFAVAYLCLAGAMGTACGWLFCALMVALNLGYVVFQDRWTFPRTFCNYAEYCRSTPFLWPTGSSVRRCIRTLRGENRR